MNVEDSLALILKPTPTPVNEAPQSIEAVMIDPTIPLTSLDDDVAITVLLEKGDITPIAMPVKETRTSMNTKIESSLFVLGAIAITALYIGVPFFSAIHQVLYPMLQDLVAVLAFLIEVGLYIMITISKTNTDIDSHDHKRTMTKKHKERRHA